MIVRYRFLLKKESEPYDASLAYPLYAWLLSRAPSEKGEELHLQGIKPISQAICRGDTPDTVYWTVSLLTTETAEIFCPILDKADAAPLHCRSICFEGKTKETIKDAHTLLHRSEALRGKNRFAMQILSPASFRQAQRYVIYPQESLILQSLVQRWGLCFPELALDDADAMRALEQGIHIADYHLRTLRYSLKHARIPSFQGRIILEAHLPVPLLEMLNVLYCFAPYAGIGIKTALGMGAVGIEMAEKTAPASWPGTIERRRIQCP